MNEDKHLKYEVAGGEPIYQACLNAIGFARANNRAVDFTHNDINLTAYPCSRAGDLVKIWDLFRELQQKR